MGFCFSLILVFIRFNGAESNVEILVLATGGR